MRNSVKSTTPGPMPVYVSLSAIEGVIGDLAKHGLAASLDEGVLKKVSSSMRRQILAGLKFLGLIDQRGCTRSLLRDLVEAHGTEAWPSALERVLRSAYKPLFAQPLHEIRASNFKELFSQTYPSTIELTRKSITFFLAAAFAAQIPLADELLEGRRVRRRRPAAAERARGGSTSEARGNDDQLGRRETIDPGLLESTGVRDPGSRDRDATMFLAELLDQSVMTDDEQQAVWTLLKFVRRKVEARSFAA